MYIVGSEFSNNSGIIFLATHKNICFGYQKGLAEVRLMSILIIYVFMEK